MPRITIDIDLDEFDTYELLDEIEDRYSYSRHKEEIEQWGKSFFGIEVSNKLSLLDQMKIDFLMCNLEKIKLNDLENLL
jgi:hypothetical protein